MNPWHGRWRRHQRPCFVLIEDWPPAIRLARASYRGGFDLAGIRFAAIGASTGLVRPGEMFLAKRRPECFICRRSWTPYAPAKIETSPHREISLPA
jgi:hypothetical protein